MGSVICSWSARRCESRLHFIVVAATRAVKMTKLRLELIWQTLSVLSMRLFTALLVFFALGIFVSQSAAAIVLSADDTYAQVGLGLSVNVDQQLNTGGIQAIALLPGYSSYTKTFFTPTFLHGSYTQTR